MDTENHSDKIRVIYSQICYVIYSLYNDTFVELYRVRNSHWSTKLYVELGALNFVMYQVGLNVDRAIAAYWCEYFTHYEENALRLNGHYGKRTLYSVTDRLIDLLADMSDEDLDELLELAFIHVHTGIRDLEYSRELARANEKRTLMRSVIHDYARSVTGDTAGLHVRRCNCR